MTHRDGHALLGELAVQIALAQNFFFCNSDVDGTLRLRTRAGDWSVQRVRVGAVGKLRCVQAWVPHNDTLLSLKLPALGAEILRSQKDSEIAAAPIFAAIGEWTNVKTHARVRSNSSGDSRTRERRKRRDEAKSGEVCVNFRIRKPPTRLPSVRSRFVSVHYAIVLALRLKNHSRQENGISRQLTLRVPFRVVPSPCTPPPMIYMSRKHFALSARTAAVIVQSAFKQVLSHRESSTDSLCSLQRRGSEVRNLVQLERRAESGEVLRKCESGDFDAAFFLSGSDSRLYTDHAEWDNTGEFRLRDGDSDGGAFAVVHVARDCAQRRVRMGQTLRIDLEFPREGKTQCYGAKVALRVEIKAAVDENESDEIESSKTLKWTHSRVVEERTFATANLSSCVARFELPQPSSKLLPSFRSSIRTLFLFRVWKFVYCLAWQCR
ncbi:MAG: hypothetical protein MHM6MM_007054 [Cercozoa sp. M6MM]